MSRIKIHAKNVTGPVLQKLRMGLGISQEDLAARCQRLGWDIARDTITRIEGRNRLVADYELFLLADALKITPASLLPYKINVAQVLQNKVNTTQVSHNR